MIKIVFYTLIHTMNTCQYTLSVEIPYGLVIVSSPNYDHDYCFKLGETMISGKEVSYYDNGNKQYEENYRDCKCNGLMADWYKNGSKRFESNYKNGVPNGLSVGWYVNGNKEYEYNYKNGKREGLSLGWYENGNKRYEQYFKNDKLDGSVITWFNEKIYENIYKDGKVVEEKSCK